MRKRSRSVCSWEVANPSSSLKGRARTFKHRDQLPVNSDSPVGFPKIINADHTNIWFIILIHHNTTLHIWEECLKNRKGSLILCMNHQLHQDLDLLSKCTQRVVCCNFRKESQEMTLRSDTSPFLSGNNILQRKKNTYLLIF